jgi:hypothetical protein
MEGTQPAEAFILTQGTHFRLFRAVQIINLHRFEPGSYFLASAAIAAYRC